MIYTNNYIFELIEMRYGRLQHSKFKFYLIFNMQLRKTKLNHQTNIQQYNDDST